MKQLLALFSLVALTLAFVPTASALIPCELCEPGDDPNTRCAGVCNGLLIQFCGDWFFYGCGTSVAAAPMSQEQGQGCPVGGEVGEGELGSPVPAQLLPAGTGPAGEPVAEPVAVEMEGLVPERGSAEL